MRTLRYEPLIKGVGFLPNPVVKYGIPDFADSASDPNVVGTVMHEDWWNEQFDRCMNGYWTGGIYIPGRYYYYLNFNQLLTIGRGYHYPEYVDLDLEFFDLFDFCKKEGKYKNDETAGGKGIISLKRRRAGVSHKAAQGIFGHGVRFNPGGYKAGVVAGLGDYADGFFSKFQENENRLPPEMQLKTLSKDMDKWVAGYEPRTSHGNFYKDGSFNTIFCRTAQINENVFKGEILNDCIFEEAGEFKRLDKCYGATKACFMAGMQLKGTPLIYGTGGNMKTSSKAFKAMLEDAEFMNLIPFDLMGQRMQIGFFIGSIDADGKLSEDCPNIKKKYADLEPEQILGCEDVERTEQVILQKREILKKATNKQPYYDYFQDNPLNRKEAFLNFSANPFDPEIIAGRLQELRDEIPKYRKVKLEWKKDADGILIFPRQVEVIPAKPEDEEHDCCLMHLHHGPLPNYKDLDVAGCDSYDLDRSATSKSLGGFEIMRRRDSDGGIIKKPIFIIRQRPKRKEIFYDNCLKACVLYNLRHNCLIDIANGLIFQYFLDNGGEKYLAPRPKAFESKDSEQMHKFGVKLTHMNKPQLIALNQSWVNDFAVNCDFPHILTEINEYDVESVDSDWDLADAHMFALLRDIDLKKAPRDEGKVEKVSAYDTPEWRLVNGVMTDVSGSGEQKSFEWERGFGH